MTDGSKSVPCPLRAAALVSPEAPALIGTEGTLTYLELDDRVESVAGNLAGMNFGERERVALYLPKDGRYIALLLALIRTGAVACPISTRLPPASAARLLWKAACKALISDDEGVLRAAGGTVRTLRPETLFDDDAGRVETGGPPEIPLSRPATVVFTSGSTGAPKAALHTFGNHYHNALGSNENIALDARRGDRWLHSLPLYHVGGLSILFRCLLAGATMVLPQPDESAGEGIVRYGATHVSLVATQLRRLVREGGAASDTLKAVLLGGGPVPGALVEEAVSRGMPVHTSYGLTEMASQVTTTPPDVPPHRLRTSGRVLPYREVSVSGEGEILVRGKTLFAGYVEDGAVNRPLDDEGWFHTGDLGELDGEGYLRVLGRRDNMFVSGGENVQPEEIEDALRGLDCVEDAVVVPVPNAEFGERPVAFVRTLDGAPPPSGLAEALENILPRFKIPVAFHEWPADAESGRMKVDRAFFRERGRRMVSRRG
jgi:O-succinylbenzoic acid--CoA ligase